MVLRRRERARLARLRIRVRSLLCRAARACFVAVLAWRWRPVPAIILKERGDAAAPEYLVRFHAPFATRYAWVDADDLPPSTQTALVGAFRERWLEEHRERLERERQQREPVRLHDVIAVGRMEAPSLSAVPSQPTHEVSEPVARAHVLPAPPLMDLRPATVKRMHADICGEAHLVPSTTRSRHAASPDNIVWAVRDALVALYTVRSRPSFGSRVRTQWVSRMGVVKKILEMDEQIAVRGQ